MISRTTGSTASEPPASAMDDERWHDNQPAPAPSYYEPDEIGAPASDQRAFPANDDQQSIGQVLHALQNGRPARPISSPQYFPAPGSSAALPFRAPILATSAPRSAPIIHRWRSWSGSAPRRYCRSFSSSAWRTWPGAPRNCGSSPIDGASCRAALPSQRVWRGSPSSRSDRRSAAKSPPWATASSARWRGRANSKRWCQRSRGA